MVSAPLTVISLIITLIILWPLAEMLPSLDNFIDFGKDIFANRPDYRGMIVDFYTTALTSASLSGDQDRVNGCKLGEAILLHLRGQVDDVR